MELITTEVFAATPQVVSMCLHLSGAQLLLSAFNNLAASRKTERKIRETDRQIQKTDRFRAFCLEIQGYSKTAYGLPNHCPLVRVLQVS